MKRVTDNILTKFSDTPKERGAFREEVKRNKSMTQ